MEKHNITEYIEFYKTFVRIKGSKPQTDYVVLQVIDAEKKDGNERKHYN